MVGAATTGACTCGQGSDHRPAKAMPPPRIELGTFCLQDRCSTTEPQRRNATNKLAHFQPALELPPNNKYHTTHYTLHTTSHRTPHNAHHHSNNNNTQRRRSIAQPHTANPAPSPCQFTAAPFLQQPLSATIRHSTIYCTLHCPLYTQTLSDHGRFHRQPHHGCPHDHAAGALRSYTNVAV